MTLKTMKPRVVMPLHPEEALRMKETLPNASAIPKEREDNDHEDELCDYHR